MSDFSEPEYTNWETSEPNGDGDCGLIWDRQDGAWGWGDYPCDGPSIYEMLALCQKQA